MTSIVPNVFPTHPHSQYRLAIIGEAPGRDEEILGRPFVGPSGKLLGGLLSMAGLSLDSCFIGNVAQYRPPENDISLFDWDGPEIQSGLAQLTIDLREYKPNLCLLLGNTPLRAAKCPGFRGKKNPVPVSDWRGSLFQSEAMDGPLFGYKCLASYHPAYVLRDYSVKQVLYLDLKRAVSQSRSPSLVLPKRVFRIPTTFEECVLQIRQCREARLPTACDIEGYVMEFGGMSMISFANQKDDGFIVPFSGPYHDGSYWTVEEEILLWRELAALLEDPLVPKILQNSLYDRFVLQWSYGICVANVQDDIMLKHWELFCELEKSLGFQTSIYTYEPFYKADRKSTDWTTKYQYCIRDSCVTKECNNVESKLLVDPGQKAHYTFNVQMLEPLLYMEVRGILYSTDEARVAREECLRKMAGVQEELNALAGKEINVKSPKFRDYLYKELRLPLQTTEAGVATANYEALLNLWKKTKNPVCDKAIQIREMQTRTQMLSISADTDGRIRCGYNVVGSETGRVTSYTSPTGSGYNLQTLPSINHLRPEGHPLHDGMRHLLKADDGKFMFQCDLEGADSWTVAAYCAMLGDKTMLQDLYEGLKPAQVLAMMFKRGQEVTSLPRADLRDLWKELNLKKSYEYFMCKIGTHGSCYTMGVSKLRRQAFVQSEGIINPSESEIRRIQSLFFARYWGVRKWHESTGRRIVAKRSLTSASGHKRQFFGRPQEILGQALADEPQQNTTYATNRAVLNLWLDSENRRSDGRLRIEPLHQVHDACVGQFDRSETAWAVAKIRQYFQNPLTIAGQTITIPFEGGYGPSWGELEIGKI
jgi:uracil-DNA glycosylase family 4